MRGACAPVYRAVLNSFPRTVQFVLNSLRTARVTLLMHPSTKLSASRGQYLGGQKRGGYWKGQRLEVWASALVNGGQAETGAELIGTVRCSRPFSR